MCSMIISFLDTKVRRKRHSIKILIYLSVLLLFTQKIIVQPKKMMQFHRILIMTNCVGEIQYLNFGQIQLKDIFIASMKALSE